MLRTLLFTIMRIFFKLFTRLDIAGRENIPASGAAILASNHLAIMDAPLIFAVLERQDATGLVGDSYKRHPIIRWVVRIVDGIWIDREGADRGALREARKMLRSGGLLGIAPEGTRSNSRALICAKTGAAYLADLAGGVPVVPIAITGTEMLFKELTRLRRPPISIRFGEAFTLPPLDRRDRADALERNTDEIMCQIAALLPPAYRGVYAEKPRLAELLANGG